MHIKDHPEPGFFAPFHNPVKHFKSRSGPHAGGFFRREQLVIERDTHGVQAEVFDVPDIISGYVLVAEFTPESLSLRGAYQLGDHFMDLPGRGSMLELEHIPFRDKPVAQIHTAQEKRFPFRVNDVASAC
jgi:hypothetical protein